MTEQVTGPFTSDAPLFYNVGVFGERGYATPNHGRQQYTVNQDLDSFIKEGGKRLSIIMHSEDCNNTNPPTINCMDRMVGLMNRSRMVLIGRSYAEAEKKFVSDKIHSVRRPYTVFPCPLFKVENPVLKEFGELMMGMIAELMQSSESELSHQITQSLAHRALRYVSYYQKRLAMELFGMTEEEAEETNLNLLTPENRAKYTPRVHGYLDADMFDIGEQLSHPQDYELGALRSGILTVDLPPEALGPFPYSAFELTGTNNPTTLPSGNLPPLPSTNASE